MHCRLRPGLSNRIVVSAQQDDLICMRVTGLLDDQVGCLIANCVVALLRVLVAHASPLAFDVTNRCLDGLWLLKVPWPNQTCQTIDVKSQI